MGYLIGAIFQNLHYHKNLIYIVLHSSGKVTARYFIHLSSILVNASRINKLIFNYFTCSSLPSCRLVLSFVHAWVFFWNLC